MKIKKVKKRRETPFNHIMNFDDAYIVQRKEFCIFSVGNTTHVWNARNANS